MLIVRYKNSTVCLYFVEITISFARNEIYVKILIQTR